jgi:1,4-alpha-glucan branching enzyme
VEPARPRILVFRRRDLYFFFNFHGATSRPDYAVPAPDGAYRLVLDSDAATFGGHARVAENQVSLALPRGEGGHMLRVYLPSRTALVFERQAPD